LSSDATNFQGYEALESTTRVLAIIDVSAGLKPVETAEARLAVDLLLVDTPFYPEGGGQVGDRGEIVGPNGRVQVTDTRRVAERLIVHRGRVLEGRIAGGEDVTARVDPQHRADTMRNHTATHLLHAALRQVLGTHVRQTGSLVAPDHLRFDFTHTEAVTQGQLDAVEALVNEKVRQNIPVSTKSTSFDEAIKEGALHFFGDKYGDEVRVVEVNSVVPRFSAELCGGTHCHRTGDIGAIVVTGESSIGSGMRRIEALSGRGAEEHIRNARATLLEIARKLGVPLEAVSTRVEANLAEVDSQRKKLEKLERSIASGGSSGSLMDSAVSVDGVRVLAAKVDAPSIESLRYFADSARKQLGSGVAVLASAVDDRPYFVSVVTQDLIPRGLHAGNLLRRVASVAGGSGGGRPDMAQGGGKDASKIGEALGIVEDAVREMLGEGV
jgi:alanyl-tRNA synthetase